LWQSHKVATAKPIYTCASNVFYSGVASQCFAFDVGFGLVLLPSKQFAGGSVRA
jgi:hypothetical protein